MSKERSAMAVITAAGMRLLYPKARRERQILRDRQMTLKPGGEPYQRPKYIPFPGAKEELVDGMRVCRLNPQSKERTLVLFLHGGGYVHEPTPFHWTFLRKLIRRTGCKVVAPIYPKAPLHTWEETFVPLETLYRSLLEENPDHRIVFMGDSAGGGMALGFGQTLRAKGLPQPAGYVLLSPWLDVTMANPEARPYARLDALLSVPALKWWGKAWAGKTHPCDPKISPIFGSFQGFSRALIFTGTREVFYPDEKRLAQRLTEAGVENELVVAPGMNHDYPILPIPEAKGAMDRICSWLNDL